MTADNSAFIYGPSAEHPGWYTWDMADPERFNSVTMGRLLVRREDLPGGGPAAAPAHVSGASAQQPA
jgi:hypothetical protein